MVRAPCCEKMGLKKGPWTPEEDQILVSFIQKNGHGNWRALPKQAGLLRCGKSCRLRWTNYLRPDIKRGNFSKEEEETIIKLHEMLGNRWSAIAARLPGRTDNEIKNVWHTHLKKKLKNYNYKTPQEPKGHCSGDSTVAKSDSKTPKTEPVSPQDSCSDFSSVTNDNNHVLMIKNEEMESSDYFPQIDESFWSEENENSASEIHPRMVSDEEQVHQFQFPSIDDGMNFWYDLFIRAGDLPELPEF